MKIQLLVDNKDSWILPYITDLRLKLCELGHDCNLTFYHEEVTEGDLLFILSCEKIFKNLTLNKYNLVVHESDLPKGRGWSPVTWQVLEGKNRIPVTLFEATEKVDDGNIYSQDFINLNGTELLSQIKHQQGLITQSLIINFVKSLPDVKGKPQSGIGTYYPRRRPKDSELDVHKSLYEQFDLLRVCDNDRYPAFFKVKNEKYILKIYKSDDK